ncbi:PQQ-binding-like beta-propeller repeat protein [Streptomyces sp. NPDC058382]|uniref:outer membrane protein assembly factor BamB family protein n=1 Tax=unclassified Streptomyces TaxID=2593676 RepID=UPI00362BF72D
MARLTRTRIQAATATAVLCTLFAGSACTNGGAQDDGRSRPAGQPAKLTKVWEAPSLLGPDGSGTVWTGQGVLVLRDGSDLRGYDARSGRKRWTLKAPKGTSGVCGMSDRPNAAGLGGLFFTAGTKGGCTYAGAVNLADGEVRWAEPVGKPQGTSGSNDLSIGDEALTVTLHCYEVKQFRPSDGKPLGTRLRSDEACAHDVDHNGTHLAVREAPAGTAKERVPGWVPADDGAPAHFALYQGADSKPVWRTKAERVGDQLNGIVSDDPLALDVTREGHDLIQTYDSDGTPVHTIGKQFKPTASDGRAKVGPFTQGDTLVVGYGRDPALYAYDLSTGKVRWKKRQDEADVLGVWKDKLLAVRQMPDSAGHSVQWLVTYGMRDGKERTIGRIAEAGVETQTFAAWDDERIYLSRPDRSGKAGIIAYPLPSSGGDTRQYAPEPEAGDTAGHGWREGDLRPDEVVNACEAVSPTARKAMRVYREGMPPPVDCAWEERDAPRHANRELEVAVTAYEPDRGGASGSDSSSGSSHEPTPAVTVAAKAYREAGQGKTRNEDDDDKVLAAGHPLKGLGDEAKSSASGSVRGSASSADILVRYRNVTVRVKARTEALSPALSGEVPPRHEVETAARVAAADVLERLGADVPASVRRPAKPAGGGTTVVKPVCARLGSEAAGLVPGAVALDTTPGGGADGRVTGCDWEPREDLSPSLTVRVEAVPESPLTGDGATELARAEIASVDGAEVSGIGDEARIERDTYRSRDAMNRDHTLTVRKGNLVVFVDYQRWQEQSGSRLDADVQRVARRVLSEY